MKKVIFLVSVMVCAGLSGCTSAEEYEEFPSFELVDHSNQIQNSSMYADTPFIAYFSAAWCSHCAPTLSAVDETVPVGNILIFNLESRAEWSNMTEWKEKMEDELERDLSHPFIHSPEVAESAGVEKIPTVLFINSDGLIEQRLEGLQDNAAIEANWADLS
jgi:thiol-disulfide isomerase/thioredoxin